MKALSKSCADSDIGVAIRIGPLPAAQSAAMAPDAPQTRLICTAAQDAVAKAKLGGCTVAELQIDFDCAESKLSGYANWVNAVKSAISPVPIVITTLPSWLKDQAFVDLIHSADAYVLQVHSLHKPDGPDADMNLCDPDEARRAVAVASRLGAPFRVALPTYSYLAGFSADGKAGWAYLPRAHRQPGRRGQSLCMMRSDPAELADLVRDFSENPPANMTGIIWYRLPISDDTMNWALAHTANRNVRARRQNPWFR